VEARLNHVSVLARDLGESARFYRELFGAEEVPAPSFGVAVRWLSIGDHQLHVFEAPDDEPPVHAHLAIEVDDVFPIVEEAKRRGILDATFGYTMAELPGGESQVYLRDPTGNLVEVNDRDGATARARIPDMILLADRLPQPDGPVPRLALRGSLG
jgi:catechol 2,3-dioxygenase-like lactoylglutathione lyase family enzyme